MAMARTHELSCLASSCRRYYMSDPHDMCPFMTETNRVRQLSLALPTWGGKRPRSGPKPRGPRALVRHAARPRLGPSTPVHVTLRMRPELHDLRTKQTYRVIASALAAAGDRFGLRVVHHSVQSTHIHLIAEASDTRALSRGMQGLSIRIAKRINALARRHGKVLGDRFHVHVLRTPREVRHALLYVLNNARKHAKQRGLTYRPTWIDPYSSASIFDGWAGVVDRMDSRSENSVPALPPRTWLLRVGWRRDGAIPVATVPSSGRPPYGRAAGGRASR